MSPHVSVYETLSLAAAAQLVLRGHWTDRDKDMQEICAERQMFVVQLPCERPASALRTGY